MVNMKPSGVQWLGDIPSEWKVAVLGRHVTQVKNKNTDLSESNLLSLSYGRIKRKDIKTNDGLLPASFDGYNIIEEGDIVLRLTDLQNDHTSLRVGRATERGIITSAYVTIRPEKNISSEYLYYVLHSFDIVKGFYGMGSGIRQGLTYDGVQSLKIPSPEMSEQLAIVDYLDDRCSKLDEIIAEAEKSIEEYKELKQAVIFEAVTKGLDKNVPMKDSGIEWVGAIPSHWLVKKFKYVASVNANLVSPDDYMDYQQIAPDCIEKDSGRLIKDRTVSEAGVESWNQLFRKGQLIYSKIRPILNKVIIAPYDGLCSADMYPLDVIEDIEFVQKAMLSKYFVEQVGLITQDRVKMPKINKEELSNILMVIPPRDEQVEIVKYLKTRLEGFDELIDEKQSLIEDLKAYKKSLIYEVVTGKRRIS